jgi:hypothetical protein
MHIDKFKSDKGYLVNEVLYHSAASVFAVGMFGFCGCSDVDSFLKMVRDGLQIIHNGTKEFDAIEDKLTPGDPRWKSMLKKEADENKRLIGHDGAQMMLWYVLDREGFIEHGSSVPGWLTDEGEILLSDLNEYFEELARN